MKKEVHYTSLGRHNNAEVDVPNNTVSKYMSQKLIEMQGEIDEDIVIVGDFNTILSKADRSRRQKVSKNIAELNSTVYQLDTIDIYRRLY